MSVKQRDFTQAYLDTIKGFRGAGGRGSRHAQQRTDRKQKDKQSIIVVFLKKEVKKKHKEVERTGWGRRTYVDREGVKQQ